MTPNDMRLMARILATCPDQITREGTVELAAAILDLIGPEKAPDEEDPPGVAAIPKPTSTLEMERAARAMFECIKEHTHSPHDALTIVTAVGAWLCDELGLPHEKRRELLVSPRWVDKRDLGAGTVTRLLQMIAEIISEIWNGWRVTVERFDDTMQEGVS